MTTTAPKHSEAAIKAFPYPEELMDSHTGWNIRLQRSAYDKALADVKVPTREALMALREERWPIVQPEVPRNPNLYGDDPYVDARNRERSIIEDFIDAMLEETS